MLQQLKDRIECNFEAFPVLMTDNEVRDINVSKDKGRAEIKDKVKNQDETDDEGKTKDKAADRGDVKLDVEKMEATFNKSRTTDVDTGNAPCQNCDLLQRENKRLAKLLNDAFNESEQTVKDLKDRVKQLNAEKNYTEERYNQIKQRSDEITSRMADVFDSKVELENVNDEISNTKLAKRFERIYNNKWPSLTEWLSVKIDGLEEVNMIKHLTSLMKVAYETCKKISDKGLRDFLALEDDEPIPTFREDPLLYKVKRKYGKTEKRRNDIKKRVWENVSREDSIKELLTEEQSALTEEGKAIFEEFFNEFADICWLITISQPKLILNFNVTGELYEGSVRDRFMQYACQDRVKDMSKVKNSIIEVVWPSVELEDGSGIHTKGDVIVVAEGANEEEISETDSCKVGTCENEKNGGESKTGVNHRDDVEGNSMKGPNKGDKSMDGISENVPKQEATFEDRKTQNESCEKGTSERGAGDEEMSQ